MADTPTLYIVNTEWEGEGYLETTKDFWAKNDSFKTDKKVIARGIKGADKECYIYDGCFKEEMDKVIICSYFEYPEDAGEVIGCIRLLTKEYKGYKICGLGKMAVAHEYRKNGVANKLLETAMLYMKVNDFDLSILWASVLKLYEKFGYVAIYKNTMLKVIKSVDEPKEFWLDSIKTLGTW